MRQEPESNGSLGCRAKKARWYFQELGSYSYLKKVALQCCHPSDHAENGPDGENNGRLESLLTYTQGDESLNWGISSRGGYEVEDSKKYL